MSVKTEQYILIRLPDHNRVIKLVVVTLGVVRDLLKPDLSRDVCTICDIFNVIIGNYVKLVLMNSV